MALVFFALLAHIVYLNGVAEDAFIAFRFARNLASGHGLVWNIGEAPVEGYTDFLWVLICAAAIRMGLDVVPFAQLLGAAAACGTVWLAYDASRRHLQLEGPVALLPPFLLAAAGPIAAWASSGMEMTLFAFFALLAAMLAADVWRSGSRRAAASAAIVLLAATLTRPEGALLALVLLALSTCLAVRDRSRFGPFLGASVLYAILFGIYFAWRYTRYGYLLPNTFYAKTGGGFDQFLRGGLLAFLFYMQFVVPLLPMGLIAVWEYGFPRLRGGLRGLLRRVRAPAFLLLSLTTVAVYTAYNVAVGGDYMAMHRFFVPTLPFIYLAFGALAGLVYRRVNTRQHRVGFRVVVAATAAATFFPSLPLERSFFYTPPQQHGNYRGVQTERWHVGRLSTIGRFFRTYRRDYSESLATSAIGAVGYYSDMRVLDVHGLVDTYIAHLPPPPDLGKRRPGHGREDLGYTLSLGPTYVMFSRDLTPEPIELWRYVPPHLRVEVDRRYVHQSVHLTDDANRQAGYFTFFELRESAARRAAAAAR